MYAFYELKFVCIYIYKRGKAQVNRRCPRAVVINILGIDMLRIMQFALVIFLIYIMHQITFSRIHYVVYECFNELVLPIKDITKSVTSFPTKNTRDTLIGCI